MWGIVSVVAAVVVVILLFEALDVVKHLKQRLAGPTAKPELEARVTDLERRVAALERQRD
ncbi:MAG: hypothetical protein WC326_14190 [Candidatus Delongbacteria bacterium]